MSQTTDPTLCRSPAEAVAAPPAQLASVAAYDPAGRARDALIPLLLLTSGTLSPATASTRTRPTTTRAELTRARRRP